jgi:hypothetical protein
MGVKYPVDFLRYNAYTMVVGSERDKGSINHGDATMATLTADERNTIHDSLWQEAEGAIRWLNRLRGAESAEALQAARKRLAESYSAASAFHWN